MCNGLDRGKVRSLEVEEYPVFFLSNPGQNLPYPATVESGMFPEEFKGEHHIL